MPEKASKTAAEPCTENPLRSFLVLARLARRFELATLAPVSDLTELCFDRTKAYLHHDSQPSRPSVMELYQLPCMSTQGMQWNPVQSFFCLPLCNGFGGFDKNLLSGFSGGRGLACWAAAATARASESKLIPSQFRPGAAAGSSTISSA